MGTPKQQTYAAQQLKDARDAFKSIQADMKSEEVEVDPTEADKGPSAAEQIKTFLRALGDLKKLYGSNVAPFLPSFAGGGVVEGPKGKPKVIEAHGGEVVFDERTGSFIINVKPSEAKPKVVNIDARHEFKEVPKDPHLWSRNLAYEVKAAI
jgi:hypothetical protein